MLKFTYAQRCPLIPCEGIVKKRKRERLVSKRLELMQKRKLVGLDQFEDTKLTQLNHELDNELKRIWNRRLRYLRRQGKAVA